MREIDPVSSRSPAMLSMSDVRGAPPHAVATRPSAGDRGGETPENTHFSRYAEVMAQMSRVVGIAPDHLRQEAARLSDDLASEAARQSGMVAVNLRSLSAQLAEAARTGVWQGRPSRTPKRAP